MPPPESLLSFLECPECKRKFSADTLQTTCPDSQSPLLARYDLERARAGLEPAVVARRARGLWRWAELLPVRAAVSRLTLGEGDTPLIRLTRLGKRLGLQNLYIKDESTNPTGSFKARGMAVAISRGLELGIRNFVTPTAGNAGGALAAYAVRGGARAHVFMPKDAPFSNQEEVKHFKAELHLVEGLISDAGQQSKREAEIHGWFDVSTFKEPYRCEGKKTLGFELAESFDWRLPDIIIYPTGGGTGLVGMWKAFDELEALGWIGKERPRMVSVQAAGCAPIVRAFEQGKERSEVWEKAQTIAAGLRVPGPFADRLILRDIRESGGTAIAVSDEEILSSRRELAEEEGILAAPEGAATLAGLIHLTKQGWIAPEESVVIFNTASGLKYV